jgi:hypothetical protein
LYYGTELGLCVWLEAQSFSGSLSLIDIYGCHIMQLVTGMLILSEKKCYYVIFCKYSNKSGISDGLTMYFTGPDSFCGVTG